MLKQEAALPRGVAVHKTTLIPHHLFEDAEVAAACRVLQKIKSSSIICLDLKICDWPA